MSYNASQAARELGVPDKTIRRWLKQGLSGRWKLTAVRTPSGQLEISEADVDRIKREREQERARFAKPSPGPIGLILPNQDTAVLSQQVADLTAKVASLEQRLVALESMPNQDTLGLGMPIPQSTTSAIPPKTKPTKQPSARKNALPDDCLFVRDFARQHGVAESTFRDMIVIGRGAGTTDEKQHIEETTRQHPTRKELQHFLTPEQQRAAIAFWQKWQVTFQQCENVACACHSTIDTN